MTPPSPAPSVPSTVRRVLADVLGLPEDSGALHGEANLFELGLDSLGVVRFVAEIETALDFQMQAGDLRAELFERLQVLITCIEERVLQESA